METLGLETLLSTKREYSVPSPSETFQTIKAALAALESAEETPAEAGEETPATP